MHFTEIAFSPSTIGRVFSYFFFALNLYTAVRIIQNTIDAFFTYNSCFDEICNLNLCRNVCAHFSIVWMNYVANFISSITILFLRREKTLKCLNDVNDLLKKRLHLYYYEFEMIAAWSVIPFFLIHCSTFFFHWKNANFAAEFVYNYLPLYITQCLPLITENMISVLLLITQRSYTDINESLMELTDKRIFFCNQHRQIIQKSLTYLKRYYWVTSDVAEEVSTYFGLDFLSAGVCSTVRFIYFLFLTLKYAVQKNIVKKDGGLVLPSYQAVVFLLEVVGKFYYLCYRCDHVVSEVCNLYLLYFINIHLHIRIIII